MAIITDNTFTLNGSYPLQTEVRFNHKDREVLNKLIGSNFMYLGYGSQPALTGLFKHNGIIYEMPHLCFLNSKRFIYERNARHNDITALYVKGSCDAESSNRKLSLDAGTILTDVVPSDPSVTCFQFTDNEGELFRIKKYLCNPITDTQNTSVNTPQPSLNIFPAKSTAKNSKEFEIKEVTIYQIKDLIFQTKAEAEAAKMVFEMTRKL